MSQIIDFIHLYMLSAVFFGYIVSWFIFKKFNKTDKEEEEEEEDNWEGAGILLSYGDDYVLGVKFNKEENKYICEYPGGKRENIDGSPLCNALRELVEETGIYVSTEELDEEEVHDALKKGNETGVYLFDYELTEEEFEYMNNHKTEFSEYILVNKETFLKDYDKMEFKTVNGDDVELREFNILMLHKLLK